MSLKLFNTLTGNKEPFEPIREGHVGMYVCGVTVYDYCHVGHARAGVVFDTIYRYLKHLGYRVQYVRNFTDIDDKIIKRAQEENVPWEQVTEKYIHAFYEDMDRLNIERPENEPKATTHLQEMFDLIAELIARDKAYELNGDVYYSVKSFETYGQLSGKNIEQLQAGARVEVDERKRDPLDFALWKSTKPGEPYWDSPWGPGRPGWHIECSAMSQKYLGTFFDIHGGGKDLVFPHHENEIAQSCGASGQAPVKYWVHNGFVNINKEKMSKSLGNFFTIRDILETFHPEALRMFLLSSHYRNPIDFSDQSLQESEKVLDRFYESLMEAEQFLESSPVEPVTDTQINEHPLMKKFEDAMNDDFNTSVVWAHINEEFRQMNTLRTDLLKASRKKSGAPAEGLRQLAVQQTTLKTIGRLLGIFFVPTRDYLEERQKRKIEQLNLDVTRIESLIEDRAQARRDKQWEQADRCRDALTEMGISLEDTPEGTLWKVK